MAAHYGVRSEIEDRFELYLTTDVEGLHEALLGKQPSEAIYPPGVGVANVTTTRNGLREVEHDTTTVKLHVMVEPGNEDAGFCWHNDIVETLQDLEDWFDRESVYENNERGQCKVLSHEVPYDVTFDSTTGVTIVVDYPTNTFSADDTLCRVRLIYGVPWRKTNEQHVAVTVRSHYLPETVDEVLGIIEIAFREDPVQDIPTCLLDEEEHNTEA